MSLYAALTRIPLPARPRTSRNELLAAANKTRSNLARRRPRGRFPCRLRPRYLCGDRSLAHARSRDAGPGCSGRLLLLRRACRPHGTSAMHLRCARPRQDRAARCCGNGTPRGCRPGILPLSAAASLVLLASPVWSQIYLRFLDVAIALDAEFKYKPLLRRVPGSLIPLDVSYCRSGRDSAGALRSVAADFRRRPRQVAITDHRQPRSMMLRRCRPGQLTEPITLRVRIDSRP